MKKLFFLFVLLSTYSCNTVYAKLGSTNNTSNPANTSNSPACLLRHLLGSNISLSNTSPNNYTLTLSLFRDTTELPFTATDVVSILTYDPISSQYLVDSTMNVAVDSVATANIHALIPFGTDVCVYTAQLYLPTGKYQFVYDLCCRNPNILNSANVATESSVFHTELQVFDNNIMNSTPNCMLVPPTFLAVNEPAIFNALPYDPDADSITWTLAAPEGTYNQNPPVQFLSVVGFSAPYYNNAMPSQAFAINPMSAEMTWTPNVTGLFMQSFQISEYRNGVQIGGVVKDMQFIVTSGSNVLSFSPSTMPSYSVDQNCNYLIYTPGQTLNFNISASETDTTTGSVTLSAYGTIFDSNRPAPATFTTIESSSIGNISGNLSWTPPVGFSQNVIVVFRAQSGMYVKDYTLLLRQSAPPTTTNVASTQQNINQVKVYPNPFHNTVHLSLNVSETVNNSDISMVDVLGQKVESIYSGSLQAGTHSFDKDVILPSGIYYIVIRNNGSITDTRCVVAE